MIRQSGMEEERMEISKTCDFQKNQVEEAPKNAMISPQQLRNGTLL